MDVYEITHIYGTGPFGKIGIRQIFVTPTIQGWLDLAATGKRRYAPQGIVHDLFVMSATVWRGQRKVGSFPYASRRIMDKLEAVSAQITVPQIRLFTGTFPRTKGGPCSQILWWRPFSPQCVLIGAEEDLGGLGGSIRVHEVSVSSPDMHEGWVGFPVTDSSGRHHRETDR